MKRNGKDGSVTTARGSGFTWLGLAVAALGWAILLVGLLVGDATLKMGGLVAGFAARSDVVTIAQTAIGTGIGLAIIGALRSGFGAFGRFFDAVLQRSSLPRPRPAPEVREPEAPVPVVQRDPLRAEPPVPPPPLRTRQKNYAILPDGSVEVETMFGTRVFATLEEAREFIR